MSALICRAGFLYPKLQDGSRQPSTGIQDADVQMAHVAKPVLDAMFSINVADAAAKGLLVAIDFEGDIADGLMTNDVVPQPMPKCVSSAAESGGPDSPSALTMVCEGCDGWCARLLCPLYDPDCIGPTINGLNPMFTPVQAFEMYATIGITAYTGARTHAARMRVHFMLASALNYISQSPPCK